MNKRNLFINLAILMGVICVSCEEESPFPSYDSYFNQQDRVIQTLIEQEEFEILSEYPENGVFKEKQFVLLDNGCYLHVIDSGNGNRAIPGQTEVLMNLTSFMFDLVQNHVIYTDTAEMNLTSDMINLTSTMINLPVNYEYPLRSIYATHVEPIRFTFDSRIYNLSMYEKSTLENRFLGRGVASALNYVSENAKVRMIVPFDTRQRFHDARYTINPTTVDRPVGSMDQIKGRFPFYYNEIVFEFESSDESTENKLE